MSNYFAAKEAKEAVGIALRKAEAWYNFQVINGLHQKIYASWRAYHGAYYDSFGFGHEVSFSGDQGEFAQIPVNHYRNIAEHILTMTTSSRPSMKARATNTDYKSQIQSYLADNILEYYMREKNVENYIKKAVNYAIVMGAGFIKLEWDSTAGEIYDYETKVDEEGNDTGELDDKKPLFEGDIKFTNLSPMDIVYDSHREDNDHDYVICRTFKNKYDLAAKYPEKKTDIEGLQTKSDILTIKFLSGTMGDDSDLVPVYELFHKKTDALPNGRYILFLSSDIILYDGAMPYRQIPLIRISPSDVIGAPYGYTPMFDLLSLQEAVNSLHSTILTNQSTFGIQNIYVPRGSDITMESLAGGLNIIQGNPQAGPPIAMNFTQTPKEVFEYLNILERTMETLSGVNSVARGNPEANLKSGTALALVQSLALQFASNLQQQYIKCIEGLGTQIIKMLQDFAVTKRTVTVISGISNRSYVDQFSSEDISSVSRVVVEAGNPLSRTTSGKLQMAENMIQYGLIKDPQTYLSVVNTGNLEVATEETQKQLFLIRAENEMLLKGEVPQAVLIEDHAQHIKGHHAVLFDPELKKDATLVKNVLDHIQDHLNLLQSADPNLLMVLGQQPLPPQQQQQPQGGPPSEQGAADVMQSPNPGQPPESVQMVDGQTQRVASPAKPPGQFKNDPTNAQQSLQGQIEK